MIVSVGCANPYRREDPSTEASPSPERGDYAHRADPRFPSASDKARTGVWFEQPHVSGRLSPTAVAEVAVRRISEVETCLKQSGLSKQRTSGRAVLELVVGSEGAVASVELRETSLHDPTFRACLLETVRGWPFPSTAGPNAATVQLPFQVRCKSEAM
jgi:hypothetical protein